MNLRNIRNYLFLSDTEIKLINSLADEYRPWVKHLSANERRLIRKYTYNSCNDVKTNRFFERLNSAMRGQYKGKDADKLHKYGNIISTTLQRQPITRTLVCYRGVNNNPIANLDIGTQFSFNQFISTSVVEIGALKKAYKYVIIVPEGTKGAYIEEISSYSGQYEFLIDKDTDYILTGKSGNTYYLEVVS